MSVNKPQFLSFTSNLLCVLANQLIFVKKITPMKNLILFLAITTVLWSCGGKSNSSFEKVEDSPSATEETAAESEAVAEEADAVCLLDNLSLRETPADKGKWITSISLGEVVTFTGEQTVDSVSKKPYYKIKLTGGKEGWSRGDFIEIDGKVGVFIQETEIYKRPDLLTKAGKKYSQMDIIAVTTVQGDWSEVKGKRGEGKYIESGWVKGGNISDKAIDIATAKFGAAALAEEDPDKRVAALTEILENGDLASSSFIPILQEKLTDMIEAEAEVVQEIVNQALDSVQ